MGSIKTPAPRMGWLTVCLLGMLLVTGNSMPVEEEIEDQEEIRELFTRLFVEEMREGRDLEMEIDNAIEDEDEGENKAIEGALQETNSQEISRFNNYIDAIYKRMNAALRAKLMDPMVLNLAQKIKKGTEEVNQRVEREAEEEEEEKDGEADATLEQEIEHRVGSAQKRNGNKRKGNKKNNKTKDDENQEKRGKNRTNKREKSDKKIEKGKKGKTQQREEKEAKKAENKLKRQR